MVENENGSGGEQGLTEQQKQEALAALEAQRLEKEAQEKLNLEKDEQPLPETKSLFELLNQKEEVKTPAQEVKTVVEAKLTPEQEEKLAKLEKLENNPIYKAISIGAEQEVIKKIAEELSGKDYSNASYAEMLRIKAENLGFVGEELITVVKDQLEKFDTLDAFERREKEIELKKQFTKTGSESPTYKSFVELYNETASKQPKQPTTAELEAENKKIADAELAVISEKLKAIVKEGNAGLNGVVLDQKLADEIIKAYDFTEDAKYSKTGQFDVNKLIADKFMQLTEQQRFENRVKEEVAAELKKRGINYKPKPGGGGFDGGSGHLSDQQKRMVERYSSDQLEQMGYNADGSKKQNKIIEEQ